MKLNGKMSHILRQLGEGRGQPEVLAQDQVIDTSNSIYLFVGMRTVMKLGFRIFLFRPMRANA